jgi:long-subunit acyl-CoA synthetase (AMP-forming)
MSIQRKVPGDKQCTHRTMQNKHRTSLQSSWPQAEASQLTESLMSVRISLRTGFASRGSEAGDAIALFLENHPRFFEICWAAQRSGLYYTAISSRLGVDELSYIVNNCKARVFDQQ